MTDCSKYNSDKLELVEKTIDSLTSPFDIDIVLAKEHLFKFEIDQYLSSIIDLIKRLIEYEWYLK